MHEEIQRIQEESEIFAGQVIEQDEEILIGSTDEREGKVKIIKAIWCASRV